jgi:hypothetical protein
MGHARTTSEQQWLEGQICGPHCDPRVLHAPQECDACDAQPMAQHIRRVWGINYTGHTDPDRLPCPAECHRPIAIIHAWGGNRPSRVVDLVAKMKDQWQRKH